MIVAVQGDNTVNEDPVQYTTPMYPLLGGLPCGSYQSNKVFWYRRALPNKKHLAGYGHGRSRAGQPPPLNEGPAWARGGALLWALGSGLLFGRQRSAFLTSVSPQKKVDLYLGRFGRSRMHFYPSVGEKQKST